MKKIEFPCLDVRLIPIDKIKPNDYNPNKVMTPEMKLLKKSIIEDGYTQPIVVNPENGYYSLIDGYHRYLIGLELQLTHLPATFLYKTREQRIASTIRHNRAKGVHQTTAMSEIVKKLLKLGLKDYEICKEIGMDAEELLRMKQIMKVEDFLKNDEYSNSWVKYKE
jgi:ParB-like chromosome segregation protein Spo0J